jgi:hypothetical protein
MKRSNDQPLGILEMMCFIAGIAYCLWLFGDELKDLPSTEVGDWVVFWTTLLAGASLAAVPLLAVDRWCRRRRRWRSGALLWFGVGLAAWGLAPACTIVRIVKLLDVKDVPYGSSGPACFLYCLPLMGLFLLLACGVGGRPQRQWWRCRGPWPEWLGMWMLAGWSLAGLYILYVIYWNK